MQAELIKFIYVNVIFLRNIVVNNMFMFRIVLSTAVFVNIIALSSTASTVEADDNINSMALYLSDRLPRELAALKNRKENGSIEIEDLLAFDQMHYDGENAMISAISSMNIVSASRVIDIGSGYGGPARYVAWKTGAYVTALELQPEINNEAAMMTNLVGHTKSGSKAIDLVTLVDHQAGNVINWGPETFPVDTDADKYDGFMSMLAFLHVDNKVELFKSIAHTLKPGARFYIEDYFNRQELNVNDMKVLKDIVSCGPLPTQSEYVESLLSAGFTDIEFQDKTSDWASFVNGRNEIFMDNKLSRIEVLGEQTYMALGTFYSSVARLFTEGRLGGTVITGIYRGPISTTNTGVLSDEL